MKPQRGRQSGSTRGSRVGRSRGKPAGGGGVSRGPGGGAKTWKAPVAFPSGVEAVDLGAGFAERASALGFELEAGEIETLGRYLGLLMAANRVMNLTAIRTVEEAVEKHLLDSLTLIPVLAEAQAGGDEGDGQTTALRVLDVGSGGGLPGLVLAICRPDASVTLLDSTEKKCGFLRHAARELGLENVTVWHDRAEVAGQDRANKREKFDVVTARAVGRLASLLEITVPFARVGGLCVLTKGQKAEEELAEAKKALHLLHAAHAGTVETPTGRIVVVEKLRKTPAAYPREIGEPKRNPLGVESDSR